MTDSVGFEKIPLYYDTYSAQKKIFFSECERVMTSDKTCTPIQAVCTTLHYHYDETIEENGMDRVAVIVLGFLFEMDRGEIDPDLACAVNWHIEDFENGDYRDLFQEECYQQLTDDMAKIKEFLKEYEKQHPGVLEYRPEE